MLRPYQSIVTYVLLAPPFFVEIPIVEVPAPMSPARNIPVQHGSTGGVGSCHAAATNVHGELNERGPERYEEMPSKRTAGMPAPSPSAKNIGCASSVA